MVKIKKIKPIKWLSTVENKNKINLKNHKPTDNRSTDHGPTDHG